jgi:uncharacterized protein YdaU (DUF1376 family)
MHKYWRHIGDYAKDTRHLSILEHGAFTLMLDWCYASEKPLPEDEKVLFRLCGAFDKAEQKAVLAVRDEFFTREQSGWTQKRVLEEIADFRDKQAKAKKAADESWKSRRNADAMQTHCERIQNAGSNAMPRAHVPATNNQQPATNLLLLAPHGAEPTADDPEGSAAATPEGSGEKKKRGGAVEDLAWAPDTGWTGFTDTLMDELAGAYPACDIRRQMLAMEQWLKANKAKARKSNWRKFVTNWLAKEQDRGGDLRGKTPFQAFSDSFGAKKEAPPLTVELPPDGYEQAMTALWGDGWEGTVPGWPQMVASDKAQVRRWLAQHGKEAA